SASSHPASVRRPARFSRVAAGRSRGIPLEPAQAGSYGGSRGRTRRPGREGDTMADISGVTLNIVKNVANGEITLDYDIVWSAFDQATNLEFDEVWDLIGDDTGQDGDDNGAGDDPVSLGLILVGRVSANGVAKTHRTKTKTIAWTNLDEDK